jgi:lipopolysaccharide export LptBFGC system permease protein LptF
VIEKCDEKRVREIIKDELGKVENNEDTIDGDTQNIRSKTEKKGAVTIVIDEMNERKSRENNLIIFGFDENQSEVRQERIDHDIQQVKELYKACKIQLDTTSIKKTGRLGKFNNEKRDRPLLVTLSSVESMLVLFKNIHRIRELTEYEKVNVSNDLTKAERE